MPPRTAQRRRCGLVSITFLAAMSWCPMALAGQTLPLQRDYPGSGPFQCPTPLTPGQPTAAQRAQAGQLASDAVQAVILGDLERAEALLSRAAEVDMSSADLAYRHARVLEDLDRIDGAMLEFCRSMSLNAESSDIDDAQQRLEDLYETVRERLPDEARDAFIAGIVQADSSFYTGAISAFSVAIEAAPDWGAPVYNRALVYESLGMIRESLSDYRLYLEIAPTSIDPVVAMVSERIGLLEGLASAGTASPGGALVLGVLPGMGHYYTRRPLGGSLVLAVTTGVIAAGFIFKDVTVECVTDPMGMVCPPEDVVGESTDRPLLLPALGVAAAVTLIGAIDAFVRAKGNRDEAIAITGGPEDTVASGWRLRPPSVSARGDRVDLNLVRVSFR